MINSLLVTGQTLDGMFVRRWMPQTVYVCCLFVVRTYVGVNEDRDSSKINICLVSLLLGRNRLYQQKIIVKHRYVAAATDNSKRVNQTFHHSIVGLYAFPYLQ